MAENRDWRESIAAIKELERQNAPATVEERVAELLQVCRDAAELQELSQAEPVERMPWPDSTRALLREKAQAIYGK